MPEVIFNGAEGRLEGRYQPAASDRAPIALVLHPHPEHGGTMNTRVVYALYHVFARRGFSVLRFNFRGVGRSQGRFDGGPGELADAASALDWLQTNNPNAVASWVGGFSFGAWIGMQLLMRRPELGGFISVAPPANVFDFSFLAPCPASGLLVNGDADPVVPAEAVSRLVGRLAQQRNITIQHQVIPGADHFFEQHMEALARRVDAYLAAAVGRAAPTAEEA